jgi:hypothetical protein
MKSVNIKFVRKVPTKCKDSRRHLLPRPIFNPINAKGAIGAKYSKEFFNLQANNFFKQNIEEKPKIG